MSVPSVIFSERCAKGREFFFEFITEHCWSDSTEVREHRVTACVDEDVLRLDISMEDDAAVMCLELFDDQSESRRVETNVVGREIFTTLNLIL